MKFIRLSSAVGSDELLSVIKNQALVNDGVKFNEDNGRPVMKITERSGRLFIRCEMVGGPTRDNGFIVGTSFVGKITEKNGVSTLRGVITTAPLYHAAMLTLIGIFVYQCFRLGGFSIVPVCIALVGFLLTKNEYKKQGIIHRYLLRAYRRAENK